MIVRGLQSEKTNSFPYLHANYISGVDFTLRWEKSRIFRAPAKDTRKRDFEMLSGAFPVPFDVEISGVCFPANLSGVFEL